MIYVFVIVLVEKVIFMVLDYMNYVFFVVGGLDVNDMNICLVCYYWVFKGKFEK